MSTPGTQAAWLLGSVVVLLVSSFLGELRSRQQRGVFHDGTQHLSALERDQLEREVREHAKETAWAVGSSDAARILAELELEQLSAEDSKRRAKAILRLSILEPAPRARRALLDQACEVLRSCSDVNHLVEEQRRLRLAP